MPEYISREELRKHLKECYDNELFDADMRKVTFSIDVYVENMPTADVQPVVRCKDCIERPHCQTHSDDFYCAFGERSDSND